jgi:hypothetical protein
VFEETVLLLGVELGVVYALIAGSLTGLLRRIRSKQGGEIKWILQTVGPIRVRVRQFFKYVVESENK